MNVKTSTVHQIVSNTEVDALLPLIPRWRSTGSMSNRTSSMNMSTSTVDDSISNTSSISCLSGSKVCSNT